MNSLILTVTRDCNLRCSYCPTVKDGWPSLNRVDVHRSLDLFVERYGGGDVKLFGGEPLLNPEAVFAALERTQDMSAIRRIYLSTNGLGLDAEWLERIRRYPKAILTVSMDGLPDDHRRLRRSLPQVADSYDHLIDLLPELGRTPRVVVTQTIAPATAGAAHENFAHLLSLGFWRFNFLPGYYVPWRDEQLASLRAGFAEIGRTIQQRWRDEQRLYVRNLFVWAPTAFFNTGMIVDSDRTIHASNLGLSASLDSVRQQTIVGDLDDPPSPALLSTKMEEVPGILREHLPAHILDATGAADAALSDFCRDLYPAWQAHRRQRLSSAA